MLKRNLVANFLGQGWAALISLNFVPSYVHFLGIEAYGIIGLFALLQAWLQLLNFGMTPTISREIARFTGGEGNVTAIRDLLRSIEVAAFAIAIPTMVGVTLAGYIMAPS
jgi:hypothetical protein